jgi:RNA polymerase sigma-70 factor (ECF subfamily)
MSLSDSFHGWLFTVVRNKLLDFAARTRRAGRVTGDVNGQQTVIQQPAPEEELDFWTREYEQQVFACASDLVQRSVKPATWQAFWQTAIEGKSSEAMARELGLSARFLAPAPVSRIRRPLNVDIFA